MNKIDEKVDELKKALEVAELKEMTRPLTVADLILEGCKVSNQAYGWGDGEKACALSAAVMAAKSRGYIA